MDSLLNLKPYVDLETGDVVFFQPTLESRYRQGFFGAVPRINPPIIHKTQFTKVSAELTKPNLTSMRLRKIANYIDGKVEL